MSIKRGLSAINKYNDDKEAKYQARQNGETGTRSRWFKLNDKESAKVIFLQEMDMDSENFSQKNDIGFIAVEHSNPDAFTRKALCSMDDEGQCWACEKHRASYREVDDYKGGWKPKDRFYINVLVDDGKEEPYVAILSQGTSEKMITPALIEQAGLIGTISDKWFNIKRKGAKFNDTSYTLTALQPHDKNVEDYELYDLSKVVREVPYAQQEAHFLDSTDVAAKAAPAEGKATSSSDSATGTAVPW